MSTSQSHQHDNCSLLINGTDSSTEFYRGIIADYLRAWNKFVPHQSEMTSCGCWYGTNLNPLPSKLVTRIESMSSFTYVKSFFEKGEVRKIMKNIISDKAHLSKTPVHYYCLPSVYLIGFPKCGTTLLYKYLESHPLFAKPRWKEGQFWREFVRQEVDYNEFKVLLYLSHFNTASQQIQKNSSMFSVDASASTIFASSLPFNVVDMDTCVVPYLLFKTLPRTKIIIVVRNPIERLWSDFWYFCSRTKWMSGNSYEIPKHIPPIASEIFHNLSILAIKEFQNCIESGHTPNYCATLSGSFSGGELACNTVRLGLSLYYVHIIRWLSIFPRKQILLFRMEDLIADSSNTMHHVWSFLSVHDIKKVVSTKVNSNSWIKNNKYSSYFKMWPETRELLQNFFHPYNNMLADLLHNKKYLWNDSYL